MNDSKLVGADDGLPHFLWTRYCMEEQWFDNEESIMYQYDLSTMLLDTNGIGSITLNNKHIRVQYYMTKKRVAVVDLFHPKMSSTLSFVTRGVH